MGRFDWMKSRGLQIPRLSLSIRPPFEPHRRLCVRSFPTKLKDTHELTLNVE